MYKNQKPVFSKKLSNNIQILQSLNELSISEIKQKANDDQSLDNFSQQKILLNQLHIGNLSAMDEYGLDKPNINCMQPKRSPLFKIRNGWEAINTSKQKNTNSVKQQNNLCFNKQIKRKKLLSKSKEKYKQQSMLLTTCHSLKQLKLSSSPRMLSKKSIKQQNIIMEARPKISVDIQNVIKNPKIDVNLQIPIIRNSMRFYQNKEFSKIYYLMPDNLKIQLNDLNYCLDTWKKFSTIDKNPRKQSRSLFCKDLKNSKTEPNSQQSQWHSTLLKMAKPIKKSEIYPSSHSQKVIEVSRPLSLQCRSVFSSRTLQCQSPMSNTSQKKSGGTSTYHHKFNRRSQMLCPSAKSSYEYFQTLVSPKIIYK